MGLTICGVFTPHSNNYIVRCCFLILFCSNFIIARLRVDNATPSEVDRIEVCIEFTQTLPSSGSVSLQTNNLGQASGKINKCKAWQIEQRQSNYYLPNGCHEEYFSLWEHSMYFNIPKTIKKYPYNIFYSVGFTSLLPPSHLG